VRGRNQRAVIGIRVGGQPTLSASTRGFSLLTRASAVFSPTGTTTENRHAALARGAEARAHDLVHRLIEIGIGHDDRVVLGAAHGLHAFSGGRALAYTCSATADDPTKLTAWMSG
jgi:hypothetical protein